MERVFEVKRGRGIYIYILWILGVERCMEMVGRTISESVTPRFRKILNKKLEILAASLTFTSFKV